MTRWYLVGATLLKAGERALSRQIMTGVRIRASGSDQGGLEDAAAGTMAPEPCLCGAADALLSLPGAPAAVPAGSPPARPRTRPPPAAPA
ncbi:hypothetical protein GCM10010345_74450 [Streptomyces canarius]|uniref:Uncharacterized protein n=1 Tax=Streptomyces canarius TaxID=285453 RepID=A0ABQ3D532_9ACTN|nr:hypothetical protein GCM10010345_74450 [Streptomyces canarius]